MAIEEESSVKVFISTDLDEWEQLTIPFQRPDYLPPQLAVSFDLEDVVLGPNGWLILAKATVRIPIWRLVPDDVKEDITGWYNLWSSSENGEEGLLFNWSAADGSSKYRFVSYEELGISDEIFSTYGSEFGNKPNLQSPNFSGWVWSQEWESTIPSEGSNGWVELPYTPLKVCCDVIGTQEGYMALTIPHFAGYDPHRSGEQIIYYSRDGHEWEPIDTPESVHSQDWHDQGDTPFTFIWSIRNHESDVLVSGHWYSFSDFQGDPIMWIIDPDGTNWREVDPADLAD